MAQQVTDLDGFVDELYFKASNLAACANTKANLYKIITMLSALLIIMGGCAIGIVSLQNNSNSNYIASSLGFIISTVKLVKITFSTEKRCIILKEMEKRLRRIARDTRQLKTLNVSQSKIQEELRRYNDEVDELDLKIFEGDIIPIENLMKKSKNSPSANRQTTRTISFPPKEVEIDMKSIEV